MPLILLSGCTLLLTHTSLRYSYTESVQPTIGPSASHLRGLTEPLLGPILGPSLARRLEALYLPLIANKWAIHELYRPGMTRTDRHLHCIYALHFVRSLYVCSKPLFNKGQIEYIESFYYSTFALFICAHIIVI